MLRKLIAKTPKIGKRIRNVGGAFIGLNAGLATLPEVPDSWLALANIALAVVMVIWGQKQTHEDVLEEVSKEL